MNAPRKGLSEKSPWPPRSFGGWKIIRAAALIQAIQSGLYLSAFSEYAKRLKDEFGWSNSAVTWAFAMTRAESGLLGPFQGWLIERIGPRRVIRVGAVLFGAGWMLLSQVQSLWQFYTFYFVVAVGASLAGFLTLTSVMVSWFQRRRASALYIGQAGFAIGGLGVYGLVQLLNWWGWRPVAFGTGIVGAIAFWLLAGSIVRHPNDVGEFVDGIDPAVVRAEVASDGTETSQPPEPVVNRDLTAQQAMRTQAFWLISFGHGTALLVVSTFLANWASYLQEQRGWSNSSSALVLGGVTIGQFIGMLLGSQLGDRMDKRKIAAAAMFGHSLGLLAFAHASSSWMVWLIVPLHGVAWGARGPLMQALRADYFGPTHFAKIMGYSSLIVMMGMMLGGPIAGILADRNGGNFTPGFTLIAGLCAFGAVWFLTLRPPVTER
jgi:MFS family permease